MLNRWENSIHRGENHDKRRKTQRKRMFQGEMQVGWMCAAGAGRVRGGLVAVSGRSRCLSARIGGRIGFVDEVLMSVCHWGKCCRYSSRTQHVALLVASFTSGGF